MGEDKIIDDNKEASQGNNQPSANQQKQQNAANNGAALGGQAARMAGNAIGGPLGGIAADKIAKTKLGQNALNNIGNMVSQNPLAKNALNAMGPNNPKQDGQGDQSQQAQGSAIGTASKGPDKGSLAGAGDVVNTVKKVKKYWPLISAAAPILLWIIAIFAGIIILMAPVMYVRDNIEALVKGWKTGVEKLLNLVEGDGWMNNQDSFFARLQKEYDRFNRTTTNGAELDIPLISSTIHYSKMISPNVYEKKDLGKEEYKDFNSLYSPLVDEDQTIAFYDVAKDKLGSPNTLWPGQKRLLGHLVKTEVTIGCVDLGQSLAEWSALFNLIGYTIIDTADDAYEGTGLKLATPIVGVFEFINKYELIKNYASQHGGDNLAYFKYGVRNLIYEATEFTEIFSNAYEAAKKFDIICPPRLEHYVDANGETKSRWVPQFPSPIVTRMNDYEGYKDYLRKVYIPATYFYDEEAGKDKETRRNEIEHIVEEIFYQRDFYLYLIGQNRTGFIGGGTCEYNVGSSQISNLKVRLLQCALDGTRGQPIPGEELVDFEKYILGVVYAEIGPTAPPEAQKVQAIAARSYALTRPAAMGNAAGLSLKEEDGQWVLSIRNCVEDQVYCDPDKGCSKQSKDQWATMYSGENTKSVKYKGPLAADAPIRFAVAEVAGKTLLDASGDVINTGYIDVDQRKWMDMANRGMDYTEILVSHYSKASSLLSNNCSNALSPAEGDYKNWKQCNSSWSSISMGSGKTICGVGCLVTSIAMQIARSGVETNVLGDFNPGTFVEALRKYGGLSNANLNWGRVSSVAPKFQYQIIGSNANGTVSLKGLSRIEKIEQIQKYIREGCYLVMEVKGSTGQHWVAVDYVEGENVYMMDPASSSTEAWTYYNWNNTSAIACYKVR